MDTENTMKGELPVNAETRETRGERRAYHRPEVHDLGKLEQMQGGVGATSDGNQAYVWRP